MHYLEMAIGIAADERVSRKGFGVLVDKSPGIHIWDALARCWSAEASQRQMSIARLTERCTSSGSLRQARESIGVVRG
jgi:hypothetical protein